MRTTIHTSRVILAAAVCVVLGAGTPARAQNIPPGVTTTVDMSGPRFGMTVMNQQTVDTLRERSNVAIGSVVSQFGWQFERRFYTNGDGVTVLSEWVPLISGLEQGVALPSLNWLVGIRTSTGNEFGIGPNITPLGAGLVVAAGVTVRTGALHVPINVAVATSQSGARVSVMTGFNIRRR